MLRYNIMVDDNERVPIYATQGSQWECGIVIGTSLRQLFNTLTTVYFKRTIYFGSNGPK
jgi:hypothetical protein